MTLKKSVKDLSATVTKLTDKVQSLEAETDRLKTLVVKTYTSDSVSIPVSSVINDCDPMKKLKSFGVEAEVHCNKFGVKQMCILKDRHSICNVFSGYSISITPGDDHPM